MTEQIQQAIETLQELTEDNSIPKNIRQKISDIISRLEDDKEPSIRVSRALADLEEIGDDMNLQSFTRMQLFNVSGMLERK